MTRSRCTCSIHRDPDCVVDHEVDREREEEFRESCIDELIEANKRAAVAAWVEDDSFAFDVIADALRERGSKIREQFALNRGTQLERLMASNKLARAA